MSRAIELAKQCDMVIEDSLVFYLSQDGMADGPIFFSQLERFYALAKADALREAADAVYGDYGMDVDSAAKLCRMAEELEKVG